MGKVIRTVVAVAVFAGVAACTVPTAGDAMAGHPSTPRTDTGATSEPRPGPVG